MTDSEYGSWNGSPSIHVFVADEATASGMARAVFRVQQTTKEFVFIYAAAPLAGVVGWLVTGFWGWLIAAPVGLAILPVATLRGLTKQFRSLIPSGTRLETEFRATTTTIRSPTATAAIVLTAMGELRPVGDFVVFHETNSRVYNALPRELFPDEELARLRQEASGA